ncbi:MAG: hypothetical protein PHC61_04510 [Chitinivibrionales bacterium]|nr:hypothetical protein [Chitinivibrionales bacterium]
MHLKNKKPPSKSLVVGVVAGVGLALLALLIYKIVISALPAIQHPPQTFNALLKSRFATVQFSPRQQDSLRPQLAGFWEYSHDSTMGKSEFSRLDRLEIKPNGYVWQVDRWRTVAPSGETLATAAIANYFITPFGKVDPKAPDMLCELTILRRILIAGKDTCYVTGVQESTWTVAVEAGGCMVEGNRYHAFDTTGKLSAFFPAGALKLVDKVSMNQCPPAFDPFLKIKELAGVSVK